MFKILSAIDNREFPRRIDLLAATYYYASCCVGECCAGGWTGHQARKLFEIVRFCGKPSTMKATEDIRKFVRSKKDE